MIPKFVQIQDYKIPIIHKVSIVRRKSISFKIDIEWLKIFTPKLFDEKIVKDFLKNKQDWIFKHRKKYNSKEAKPRQYKTWEKFKYKWKEYKLLIVRTVNDWCEIVFDKQYFLAYINDGYTLNEIKNIVWECMDKWYFVRANIYIKNRVLYFSEKHWIKVKDIVIKHYKSKFWECWNSILYFNYNIIKFPIQIIDHIILHEMAHIKHHNHSPIFRDYLKWLDSNFHESKKRLKEYGWILV